MMEGDARAIPLPDASVQAIITSPPYWGLRDYGVPPTVWQDENEPLCGTFARTGQEHTWMPCKTFVKRGDPIGSSLAYEDVRVHTANTGEQCPKCDAWRGCLGLEPTVGMYVDHMVQVCRELKRVLRPDGILFLNIGDSYDGKTKQRVLVPHRLALALQADGWIVRSDIIWAKGVSFCKTYAGSVMPESIQDRPVAAHEHILMLTKSKRYFYDKEAIREEGVIPAGTLAAKGSGLREGNRRDATYALYDGKRNLRDVWTISSRPFKEAHFATFPPHLVEPMVRASTPPHVCAACSTPYRHVVTRSPIPAAIQERFNASRKRDEGNTGRTDGHTTSKPSYKRQIESDTYEKACACNTVRVAPAMVLDPFAGAGTVPLVCRRLGRACLGIEPNLSYIEIAETRLEKEAA